MNIYRIKMGDPKIGHTELTVQGPEAILQEPPGTIKEERDRTQRAALVGILQLLDWLDTHEQPLFCRTVLAATGICALELAEATNCSCTDHTNLGKEN